VPEAIGQGRPLEEAKAKVTGALGLVLAWRGDEGERLPDPVEVAVTPVAVPRPAGP
jgi:predicted RNase H-like HicB family nuclease